MSRLRSLPRLETLEIRCQPATFTWTGKGGADTGWSNKGNWDLNMVPGAGDEVLFTTVPMPASGSNTVDVPFSVAALKIDLSWNGGTTINSNLTIAGGTWSGSHQFNFGSGGSLTNTGAVTIPGAVGTAGGGTLINNGTISMTGLTWTIGGGAGSCKVENNGTINLAGVDDLQIIQGSSLFNTIAGVIDFKTAVNIEPPISVVPGILNNTGLIRKSGPGTSLLRANMLSTGSFDIQSGNLSIQGATFTFSNEFKVSGGATCDLTNTFTTSLGGDLIGTGAGKIVIDESTTTLMGDTKLDFKTIPLNWSGGTINLNNFDLEITSLSMMIVLPLSATSTVLNGPGKLINEGTISHTGAGNLAIDKGVVLENTGTYEFQSDGDIGQGGFGPAASILNSGLFRKVSGSLASFINVSMTSTGDFDVQVGELELRLPTGTLTDPAISVAAGAVFDLTGGLGVTLGLVGTAVGTGLGKVLLGSGTLKAMDNATLDFADGMFEWVAGTIDTGGKTLTNAANRFFNITSSAVHNLTGGGKFVNQGTVSHTGAGNLLFNTAGTLFENVANYVFESSGDIGTSVVGIGEVINKGLIRKLGIDTAQINVKMTGEGDYDIQLGQLQFRLPVGSLLTNPSMTVSSGGTVDLAGVGTLFGVAGTFVATGAGGVLLSGGTLLASQDCVLDFASDLFNWTGGIINTNGKTLTNAIASSINVGAASLVELIGGGSFLNLGSWFHTGTGDVRLKDAGTILNNVGEYVFEAAGSITAAVAGVGKFISDGLVRKINAGVASIEALMMSAGDFEVQAGELEIKGNGATVLTSCDIDIDAGATFDLTGGTTVKYAGEFTIDGQGEVILGGGTIQLDADAAFRLVGGTPEFHWSSGAINTKGFTVRFEDVDLFIDPIGGTNVTLSGGGLLRNSGEILHNGAGDLRINDVGTKLINEFIGGKYSLNSTGDITFAGAAGQFVNIGLFERNAAGSSSITTAFDNIGTVSNLQGQLIISGKVTQINGMTLTDGAWNALNGSTLNLSVPIDTNQAEVRLDGPGASFTNFFLDVNDGMFELTGGCDFVNSFALKNSGTILLSPGSSLSTIGNSTNTGTFIVQIDGSPVSGKFGIWNVSSALTLGGTLIVQRPNGFVPSPGDTYKIHTYASRVMDYANVSGLTVAPNLVFDRQVNATDMLLTLDAKPAPIAKVQSVVVNDGSTQRSMVTSLKVTFNQVVSFLGDAVGAFALSRTGPSTPPYSPTTGAVTISDLTTHSGQTVVTLTFTGPITESQTGSLIDGNYELRVLSTQVANLDGDGDGTVESMDDYVSPSAPLAGSIFRLFGDGDGNGVVNSNDFALIRGTFGTGLNLAFDFDGDGAVDADDFSQFRKRFGLVLTP